MRRTLSAERLSIATHPSSITGSLIKPFHQSSDSSAAALTRRQTVANGISHSYKPEAPAQISITATSSVDGTHAWPTSWSAPKGASGGRVLRCFSTASWAYQQALLDTNVSSKAESPDILSLLDYKPQLSFVQKSLCIAVSAAVVASAYLLVRPSLNIKTTAAIVLLFGTLATLIRMLLIEGMYKAIQRSEQELGDPDSHFICVDRTIAHIKVKLDPLRLEGQLEASNRHLVALHCYHGFGANVYSFEPVQELLAQRLGGLVTSHDMPGFGLTKRPSDISSYFLAYNGRLGRLVMDHQLSHKGLMPTPAMPSSPLSSTGVQLVPSGGLHASDGHTSGGSTIPFRGLAPDQPSQPGAASSLHNPDQYPGAASVRSGSSMTSSSSSSTVYSIAAGEGASGGVKRILLGHSLGGACATLEALENPDGIDALILVAPAVIALPGKDYDSVVLAPSNLHDVSCSTGPDAPAGSNNGDGAAAPVVTRFVPVGSFPAREKRAGAAGSSTSSDSSGSSSCAWRSFASPLARWCAAVGQAVAVVVATLVLRVMKPIIVGVLRSLVRNKSFWRRGLSQAYYDKGMLSDKLVDAYRLPQLVRGWENGLFNFLVARLAYFSDSRLWGQGGRGFVGAPEDIGLAERLAAAAAGYSWQEPPAGAAAAAAAAAAPTSLTPVAVAAAAVAQTQASHTPALASDADSSDDDTAGAGNPGATAAEAAAGTGGHGHVRGRHGTPLKVLIIHGECDRLVPFSNSQRLARMLPSCELVGLSRVGHMPQEEVPQLFADIVTEFVQRAVLGNDNNGKQV